MERTSNWESLFGRRITRRRGLAAVGAGMAAALLAACGDDGESSLSNNIEWSQDGMNKVVSRDGTVIAFDRLGQGTPVILVAGALGVRAEPMMADLAMALAPHHTVYNYDRRGRGDSGDTQPYAVEREIEDIEAILNAAGGSGSLYGLSSGAALILEAANKLPTKVRKLALYEPPFIVDDTHPPLPEDYVDQVNAMVASGRRGDAVALFMKVVGVPEELIPQMRAMPMWPDMEKVAHTLAYDGTIMGDNQSGKPLAPKQWTSVTSPTLVIVGGESEPFFHHGAQALVEVLPNARRQVLEGQSHGVDAAPLAPVLVDFFVT
jgi:pimeloyl-ACP methyl ester carboxylesterase